MVDMVDVLLKVHEAYSTGKEELKADVDTTSLLFQCSPTTPVEVCNFYFPRKTWYIFSDICLIVLYILLEYLIFMIVFPVRKSLLDSCVDIKLLN